MHAPELAQVTRITRLALAARRRPGRARAASPALLRRLSPAAFAKTLNKADMRPFVFKCKCTCKSKDAGLWLLRKLRTGETVSSYLA